VGLIVLDEPTSGLDPLMEQVFQEVIRERCDQGATVLLSSHILSEVEALADRVSIIRRGRTVTSGTLAELRRHTRTSVRALTGRDVTSLSTVSGVEGLTVGTLDGHVETRFTVGPDQLDRAIGLIHDSGIHGLTVEPPSLDALFLSNYRDDAAPAGHA
jgi:ABC-2 type transport system ATP-binding protein